MLLPILKANGKLKDLCIPFIWASRGFFLSRGLEIKPSGYGDKKERGRFSKTSTTTGTTVQVHLKTGLNNGRAANKADHESSSVPFDMALTLLNLPKIFKKMTTEDPKGGHWSKITGW